MRNYLLFTLILIFFEFFHSDISCFRSASLQDKSILTTNRSKRGKHRLLSDREQSEQHLIRTLFHEYVKQGRPVYNSNQSVEVTVSLSLQQISDLDERTQTLTSRGWLEVIWHDEMLVWNASDWGGTTRLSVLPRDIWIPDLAIGNSVGQVFQGSYYDIRVSVNNDGTIYWWPGGIWKTSCNIEIFYYPFDDQKCSIIIMGWSYFESEVHLVNASSSIGLVEYTVNGLWDLHHTSSWRYSRVYPNGKTPEIYFDLYMKRKMTFVMVNILLPCVMISALALMVFYLAPDSGEKISLGTTVLLAFTIFLLLITEIVPKTADVPLIIIYLMSLLAMTTMSVILSVFVLRIHHHSKTSIDDYGTGITIPTGIIKFVIKYIAPIVFCRRYKNLFNEAKLFVDIPVISQTKERKSTNPMRWHGCQRNNLNYFTSVEDGFLRSNNKKSFMSAREPFIFPDEYDLFDDEERDSGFERYSSPNGCIHPRIIHFTRKDDEYTCKKRPRCNRTRSVCSAAISPVFEKRINGAWDSTTVLNEKRKISPVLKSKQCHHSIENQKLLRQRRLRNFKFAALACDRLFLYLFLVINITLILVLLVFIPGTKPLKNPTYVPMFPPQKPNEGSVVFDDPYD